ncbi:hypothetical protein, partial [Hydrogenispora ethanolica]|uniref:hypothetical protein n=1 Tax=Hydrogenispora ethanolica TaxID=1082276 RepID=UPI001A9FE461
MAALAAIFVFLRGKKDSITVTVKPPLTLKGDVWEGTIYSKKVQNVQRSVLKQVGVIRVIRTETQKIVTQMRLSGWSEA